MRRLLSSGSAFYDRGCGVIYSRAFICLVISHAFMAGLHAQNLFEYYRYVKSLLHGNRYTSYFTASHQCMKGVFSRTKLIEKLPV